MDRHHKKCEESLKHRWLYGISPDDLEVAHFLAYGKIVETLQTMTFEYYEKLKDELNERQRH